MVPLHIDGLGIVILNFESLVIYRLFWLKTKELVDWRFLSPNICWQNSHANSGELWFNPETFISVLKIYQITKIALLLDLNSEGNSVTIAFTVFQLIFIAGFLVACFAAQWNCQRLLLSEQGTCWRRKGREGSHGLKERSHGGRCPCQGQLVSP